MALTRLRVALHNTPLFLQSVSFYLGTLNVFVYKQPEKERESLTSYSLSCFVGFFFPVMFINNKLC